ncbi:FtsH protease activity modulator HflK [Phytohalomonas tamaricis]|uniref:FtsH protease activity modulator HflK n=1 Tax=Phytohalomonas tamaricis TaxID=2081032 RepID=UPI000D0B5B1D|nr:FtsH protease activity modulator HflK [Phytohalomonas tamaricis]
MAWNEPGGNNQKDPWGGGGRGNGGNNGGGGNKPNGPPDLDETLKKLQNKLNGLFSKRRSGGNDDGNNNGNGGGRSTFMLPGVLVIVAIAVWFASGFYLVDQSERGVVLRFGKYLNTVNPGLHWNAPIVDDIRTVNVTQVRSLTQSASMLTQDENIVQVRMSVQYLVSNPRDFVLHVQSPEMSLENALDSALRHEVGGTDMNEILTSGRELLSTNVNQRLQSYLDAYGIGIQLQAVNVEGTSAPDQVQEAFDDVIKAREDRQRSINEALAYENSILPRAQGEAQRVIEEAKGYKESIVAEAQGDASRFTDLMREYEKAPAVTRERLYLETMSDVFSKTSKALIDVDQGNSVMYLPLDKLGQGRQTRPALNNDDSQNVDTDQLEALSQRVVEHIRQNGSGAIQREGRQ